MDADWSDMLEWKGGIIDRCHFDRYDPLNVTPEFFECIRLQIDETQREIERIAPGKNYSLASLDNAHFDIGIGDAENSVDECDQRGKLNQDICDKAALHLALLGYCYPALLTLCLFGNTLNLIVYTAKYLRKSLTVKLLLFKAIMNSLFMIGLSPQVVILLFNQISAHAGSSGRLNGLWSVWPYSLFLSNVAGTCATWLTVLMTFERFLYITFPLQSRKWCTNVNFLRACAVLFTLAIGIHIAIPLNRVAESRFCPAENRYLYKLYARSGKVYETLEPIYYWTNLILVMTIPSLCLMTLTVGITHKMLYCSLPNYSERKRCVTRITLATTACHLTLATPAVGVYAVAVVYGPTFMNQNWMMCLCHVLMNFSNQLNASVCFLIYISCSDKFRKLLLCRLRGLAPAEGALGAVERTRRCRYDTCGDRSAKSEGQKLTVPAVEAARRSSLWSDDGHSAIGNGSPVLTRL